MTASFDPIADRYDATRGGESRGRQAAEALRPWLIGPSVLEACVGTGVVATALASFGFAVTGVDLSPKMARYARERLGDRIALGDARRLPVLDSSVDSYVIVFGLHLVGDIDAALAEAARVVRPGGRVAAIHSASRIDDPSDLHEAQAALVGVRSDRPDTDEAVGAAATAAGLRLLHRDWTSPRPVTTTPREAVDAIEGRLWWYLHRLSDEQYEQVATPVLARLRSLPDPDRPRTTLQSSRLAVFSR
jgi:ubiquinone/menaquinone biosynthesis C-methylase UbiE